MLIGVVADDFTGAGDIANTLARGLAGQGLITAQYLGVPRRAAHPEVEAGVVALKSRSVPAADAVAASLEALAWLRAQGCRQVLFKHCSTFDSTPEGNIGPVAEALAGALGVTGGVAVCPAFPAAGRTVYQGHLFVDDVLLSESGMRDHPLTPMTDPDLRRWLRLQTTTPVGHVPEAVVRAGAEAIDAELRACADRGEVLVVVDAIADSDLVAIGRACADAPLIIGGSGIALGLPAALIEAGLAAGSQDGFAGVQGPEVVLAGSCSGRTRSQVEAHARRHPTLAVDVEDVMDGRTSADEVVAFVASHAGEGPLVYSSAAPTQVAAAHARHGREVVSGRLEGLFARAAERLVDGGVNRLVVAGGETSGAVAQALGLAELRIGPEISPGVPVLVSPDRRVALALKSGNFGGEGFFDDALVALAGGSAA